MKTRPLIALISVSFAAAVMTQPAAANEDAEARQPVVQAQQVYRYVYKPENFNGSIEHSLQLAQDNIMTNMRYDMRAVSRQALQQSHNELRLATQVAAVSEMLPDRFFSGASDTLSRAN